MTPPRMQHAPCAPQTPEQKPPIYVAPAARLDSVAHCVSQDWNTFWSPAGAAGGIGGDGGVAGGGSGRLPRVHESDISERTVVVMNRTKLASWSGVRSTVTGPSAVSVGKSSSVPTGMGTALAGLRYVPFPTTSVRFA